MSEVKTLMDFVKEAKSQITEIDVAEVVALLDGGYQVLDVREPGEFQSGTVGGAHNVPRGVLEAACDLQYSGHQAIMQDRDKKWLLLCATSGRSAMAALVMQQMGFKDVKNIVGGIVAWKSADMAVVTP